MKIMKTKKILTMVVGIALSVYFCAVALAAMPSEDPPPLAMLRNTADKMIAELNHYRGRLKGNDQLTYNIVRRVLLPHCDLVNMSRTVVGREYWSSATPAMQKQFIDEFTFYVVRTYSTALASYSGEKVKFYPIRGFSSSQNRYQVDSDILQERAPPVRVSYRVMREGGEWYIYNFIIEGVGLVQNYNSQFAATLHRGGLSELVTEIRAHNRGS